VQLQPYDRRLGFWEGDFRKAGVFAGNAIILPLYTGLQNGDQQR